MNKGCGAGVLMLYLYTVQKLATATYLTDRTIKTGGSCSFENLTFIGDMELLQNL